MADIFIIDDDYDFNISLQRIFQRFGHNCSFSLNLKDGLENVLKKNCDIIFLDVNLPDGNGADEVKNLRAAPSSPEVVMLTGLADPKIAALAIRNGAWDYLEKPISLNTLRQLLKRILEHRERKTLFFKKDFKLKSKGIIGESNQIIDCLEQVAKAASSKGNVIITGETGTGKELIARAIHENSERSDGRMVVIDCTNLPRTLRESLLFGHVKGAFTGATEDRDGLFKLGDKGTVFLDEVGEMDIELQRCFLRVLQEGTFRPIGSSKELKSDFRVVAATNRDIEILVKTGKFRQDLYYRLNGIRIHLPPLRERKEDIKPLTYYYVQKICNQYGIAEKEVSDDFLESLFLYHWPGNVRELVNALFAAIDNSLNERILYPHHLPMDIRAEIASKMVTPKCTEISKTSASSVSGSESKTEQEAADVTLWENSFQRDGKLPTFKEVRKEYLDKLESKYLRELTIVSNGDVQKACKISGLSRARLYELLKKHGVSFKR